MPAAQIQIGEEKDDQRRADGRLDAGAPDALGLVLKTENLPPEAEVDADISEDRPGERRRGGKDQGAAHDEDDRQEQREQPGDADEDALVERQARPFVLIGVRLPEVDLRQRRRAQFRDIGDGRAGVERQAKYVGVDLVLALGRIALARGDGGDARGAEIGPHDAGADEAEVRRDDQARQLLVGIVGERENDPGGLRPRLQRAHLDAPHDAVGAWRGRNLDAVALRAVVFDGRGQVDGVGVGGNANRLNRQRGLAAARRSRRVEPPPPARSPRCAARCRRRPARSKPGCGRLARRNAQWPTTGRSHRRRREREPIEPPTRPRSREAPRRGAPRSARRVAESRGARRAPDWTPARRRGASGAAGTRIARSGLNQGASPRPRAARTRRDRATRR